MNTNNYFLKQIANFFFSENIYHKVKLYKIISDFKFGKPYEISPILSHLIKDTDIILDIGANMGQFACRFNGIVSDPGHVYSFEPVSFNYFCLIRMKKLLRLNNTTCYKYAISDKDGLDSIKIPIFSHNLIVGTQSSLGINEDWKNYREENIVVRSIDSIVKELNIPKVDFIKSDTEGNEINVLEGGYITITTNLPTLYLEINFKNDHLKKYYDLGYIPFHYLNKKIERIKDFQKGDLFLIHTSKIKTIGVITF